MSDTKGIEKQNNYKDEQTQETDFTDDRFRPLPSTEDSS